MKTIFKILIGIVLYFVISVALEFVIIDSELIFKITGGLLNIYFLILTIIPYVKNVIQYFKNNVLPQKAPLLKFVDCLLGGKIFKFLIYTAFYISVWCFLGYTFYTAICNTKVDTIVNILLTSTFLFTIIPIIIIMLQMLFVSAVANFTLNSPSTEIKNEIKFSKDLIIRLLNDSVVKKIGCICEFMYNHRKHSIGVAYYNENEIIYFLDNQEFNNIEEFLSNAVINDTKLEEINDEFVIKSFNNYSYKELEQIKEKQSLI